MPKTGEQPTRSYRARVLILGAGVAIVLSILPDVAGSTPAEARSQDAPDRSHLRVVTAGSAPFVMANGAGGAEGLSLDVWSAIAEDLALEYEMVPAEGISEAIDMVAEGRADVVVGPVSITADRSVQVEFTQPYFNATLAILAPASRSLLDGIAPFLSRAFLTGIFFLLGILLVVGVLLWMAERRANAEHFPDRPLAGIGNGIWAALVTLTTVGYGDVVPRSLAGRVVAGAWMLMSVVVASSFTAFIATALTLSQIDTGSISTAGDLAGRRVGSVAGTTSAEFASENGARLQAVADIDAAFADLQAERTEAIVFDRPILRYLLARNPGTDFLISEPSYRPQGYGFALAMDSAVRQEIVVAILRLQESGELDAIAEVWLGP